MEQGIIEFVQVFGVGVAALMMFLWSARYRSKVDADAYKLRETVEAQGRETLRKLAESQSAIADKLAEELLERERLISQKSLELLEVSGKLQRSEILLEDSQYRLVATERVLEEERSKVRAMNDVVSKLGQQVDDLKRRMGQMEQDLAAERAARDDIEHEMKSVQSALNIARELEERVRKTNDELTADNARLRAENETLRRDLDALRADKQALEKRLEDLEAKFNEAKVQEEKAL